MWDFLFDLNLQGPKGDAGEPGHPGERGEKGEMGLSGPAVSTEHTLVAARFLNVIQVESNSSWFRFRVWMGRKEKKVTAGWTTTW